MGEDDFNRLVRDLNTPSWEIRCDAVEDLADLEDPRATSHVLKALNDPVGAVRYTAAAALGRMGDPKAVPFLVECLENTAFGPPAPVLEALGNLRVKEAIPCLIRYLRDPDARTRGVANNSLMVTTGRSMGFKPGADEHSREASVAKWEEWWEDNKETFVVPGKK